MAETDAIPATVGPRLGQNSLLMSSVPQALALLAFGVLGYFSIKAAYLAELLPEGLSTYIEDDSLGIILVQCAGFIAFLVLCIVQYVLTRVEAASLVAGRKRAPLYMKAVGHRDGWIDLLDKKVVAPKGEALETVLGQHEDARLSILKILLAAFPTTGFIGTVLGIMQAIAPLDDLAGAGGSQSDMSASLGEVVAGLELAFSTTLVGLVLLLMGSFALGLVALTMRATHARALLIWQG